MVCPRNLFERLLAHCSGGSRWCGSGGRSGDLHFAGLRLLRPWWDGIFLRPLRSRCIRKGGMCSSTRLSLQPAFSSGGPLFSLGQVRQPGRDGRCFCTSFSPRCPAIFSRDFLCSPNVSPIRCISRPRSSLTSLFYASALQRSRLAGSTVLSDYWSLTKPEINVLIGLAAVAAFCLGCHEPLAHFPLVLLVDTVLGTVLVASGAGTLNQLIERQF